MWKKILFIVSFLLMSEGFSGFLLGQESGSIWIKTFKPGSANVKDETIDPQSLAFLDSLMKRTDIEVIFLGGADQLKWKSLPQSTYISNAFDQAKKLERASLLRARYGAGEIGITDEPIRGIKVVWSPKRPDPFKMQGDILALKAANDSLYNLIRDLSYKQNEQLTAIHDSLIKSETNPKVTTNINTSTGVLDWEIKAGVLTWSGGGTYDLSVPCIGLALKRRYWAFEIEGGFTPWSRPDRHGERGDALLMGAIAMFPRKFHEIKAGAFSGWEFLSRTDQWTMKVMGITMGPSAKWKFIDGYLGYTLSKLSTLTMTDRWNSGLMLNFNFKFLMN